MAGATGSGGARKGKRTVKGADPKKAARKRHTSKVSIFLASAHGMLKMANKA